MGEWVIGTTIGDLTIPPFPTKNQGLVDPRLSPGLIRLWGVGFKV